MNNSERTRFTPMSACGLRNNSAFTQNGALCADHRFRRPVVVLTYVLEQFESRTAPKEDAARPCRRVRAGIVDRHFILQRVEIGAREAFDQVELLSMRTALPVHPEPRVVTHRI